MFPELVQIPFINRPIYSYGALIFVGLLVALFVAYRTALKQKKYHNDVVDFAAWGFLGGLLGTQIVFIIVEFKQYFILEPFTKIPGTSIWIPSVLAFWNTGLVFWGGPIGGIVALIIFCKRRKIPVWEFADICILGLPLGQAFGRLGCLASGCCFGEPRYHIDAAGNVIGDVPFALSFPPQSFAYKELFYSLPQETVALMEKLGTTVPLFPVQLLDSVCNVALFFVLLTLVRFKRVHGQIILSYLILYSIMRSFIELVRGDISRGFVVDDLISTSQFISIVVSIVAVALLAYLISQKNRSQTKQQQVFAGKSQAS